MRRGVFRSLAVGMVVAAVVLGAVPAEAAGTLTVQVVPVPGTPVTVKLVAPGGTVQAATFTSAVFELIPKGGPGTYQITMTAGGVTETAAIEVPRSGRVAVTFKTNAAGAKITAQQVAAVASIVVTAERVEEEMQKVPVAVTAIGADQLEAEGIDNIQEVAASTPNLWMEKNTGTSSGSRAAIRGIGEDESFFTSDTPVGIYIDDIYIPRQIGAQFDLYEVERVEVLRGPQGTLYGRNTSAGAIKIITKQPGNVFSGSVEATLGNYSRTDLLGFIGGPMSERSSIQVAGMLRRHDGYDENLYNGDDVNDQDVWGLRASLRFFPTDSVDVLIVGDSVTERSTPGYPLGFVPQPPFINGYGAGEPDFAHQIDGDTDPHTLLSDLVDPLNDLDQRGAYATVTWQATAKLTAKSVSGWRKMDNLLLLDGDGQVGNHFLPGIIPEFLPLFHIFQDQHQKQLSQEFQLVGGIGEKTNFVAGLYLFHEENEQITENAVLAPLGSNRYTNTGLTTDSFAAYGSFDFQLSATTQLTVGGRWTNDNKDFDLVVFNPDDSQMVACVGPDGSVVSSRTPCDASAPPGSVDVPVEKHLNPSWSQFTPRFVLTYAPRENLLAYASISNGFKSGAFDGRANEGATVLPLEPVPPETVWSYEAGLKTDLFDRRWRLNLVAFFMSYDDLQGTGTDPNGNFLRFSIGDVETKGLEVESSAALLPGLEVRGNVSFLDTEFTKQNFNQAVDCAPYGTGDKKLELKYSPKTSYRLSASYTTPSQVAGGYWSMGANLSHRSRHYLGFCNAGAQTQQAYDLVGAVISFEPPGGRWRIALNGENLTDEAYIIGVFAIPGLRMTSGYIGPPRTWAVSVRYRF